MRHHVLLIGIDAYRAARPLAGCVNDIDALQALLIERLGVPPEHIRRLAAPRPDGVARPTQVPTEEPTRDNLIRALEALGTEAVRPEDRVFVYYSGHGTLSRVVTREGSSFMREALVAVDEQASEGWEEPDRPRLLFDWELNALLRRITARTPSVTVVLDACCSAGATRQLRELDARDRFVEVPAEARAVAEGPPSSAPRGVARGLGADAGRSMVVAACLDCERARESDGPDGTAHGELTRALLAALATVPDAELAQLSWGRIWRPIAAAVSQASQAQHPWRSDSGLRLVFGGPPVDGDIGYAIAAEGEVYRLDAGSLSGVTRGARVAVYPALPATFPPLGSRDDLALRLGVLRVDAPTERARATAVPESPTPFPPLVGGERGRLILAGEAASLTVALAPHDAALEAALGRLGQRSGLFAIAPRGARGDVTLAQLPGGEWVLTDDAYGAGDDEPRLPLLPPGDVEGITRFLEHYHRYSAPLRLAAACTDMAHSLRVSLLDCSGFTAVMPPDRAQDPDLSEVGSVSGSVYTLAARGPRTIGQLYCVRVDNSSTQGLHVTLFSCEDSGQVQLLASRLHVPGRGFAVVWPQGHLGRPFRAVLEPGRRLGLDRLVAIGTNNGAASFDHLRLDKPEDTFRHVLRASRGGGAGPVSGRAELWTSALAVLRLVG